jgi:hypothetical protein
MERLWRSGRQLKDRCTEGQYRPRCIRGYPAATPIYLSRQRSRATSSHVFTQSPQDILHQCRISRIPPRIWWGHAAGGAVVEAQRYKPEGRAIDSRFCHLNVSLTLSFRSQYDPGVDSTSNRNEYQGYFLGVKAAGA